MINDYYEYQAALQDIVDNKAIDPKYLNRFIILLSRRFAFYITDENGNFINDYYSLVDKNNKDKYRYSRKRLRVTKKFIKYFFTGEIEDKVLNYLKMDLTRDTIGNNDFTEDSINKIIDLRNKKNKINLSSIPVTDKKIEFSNLDAVIDGPLRKNVGIVFSKEQIKRIIETCDERAKSGTLQYNYSALSVMVLSYYFYHYNMTHKKVIPFTIEHHRRIHGFLKNYFFKKGDKLGFAYYGLLGVQNITDGKINGTHLTWTKKLDDIFGEDYPKVVTINKSEVFSKYDDDHYVYVDKGKDTFSELKDQLKYFYNKN